MSDFVDIACYVFPWDGHIDDVITRTLRTQESDIIVTGFQEGKYSRLAQTACFLLQLAQGAGFPT
jgi:hypothetical protein